MMNVMKTVAGIPVRYMTGGASNGLPWPEQRRMFMRRVRVKPSKSQSLVGMIGGAVFVIIGFSIVPMAGVFGVFWTIMALAIAGMHAYNYFSDKGVASWEIDVETNHQVISREENFETRLRKLNRLKEDGLITESEFEKKRAEIIKSEW